MTKNSSFAELVKRELAPSAAFDGPTWYHDEDGDCIEFITSGDRFYGERKDDWVTAYYSYESNELIGSQIKGISLLLGEEQPGFVRIEIRDGKVRLSHLYRASGWTFEHQSLEDAAVYNQLIELADEANAEIELVNC